MRRVLLAALLLLGAFAPAPAADYPTKPIRIVVPYGPGGATDIVARILGEQFMVQPTRSLDEARAGSRRTWNTGSRSSPTPGDGRQDAIIN